MKNKISKQRIIFLCIFGLIALFLIIYDQTKIEKLFYNTNTSKITYNAMKNKMRVSSFLHRYKLTSEHSNRLILYKDDGGLMLSYQNSGLSLMNSISSSKISENDVEEILSKESFKEIKQTYGTPKFVDKDENNKIRSAGWSTSTSTFSLYFDEYGRAKQ